ncbi:MAG: SusC/RagA family TonB-linked outer membrane protein [Bacteroidales bacterium]|nr:SusC/RagA family TonB-linked outer membrane protein [Bacteroidales bacterium]MBN2749099.1 SusC/RagA family TonB-linked outer membrane protein [Bacteroidales bacterium]
MKKKPNAVKSFGLKRFPFPFLFRRMAVLLCLTAFGLGAMAQSPIDKKISIHFYDKDLRSVLNFIGKESGVKIFYKDSDVKKDELVTVSLNDATVKAVLDKVLGTKYTYQLVKDQIVILPVKKKAEESDPVQRSRYVSGIVTDDAGNSLPGVTVYIAGYNIGASTNADGRYNINVPGGAKRIRFSFIGYQTQEFALSAADTLNATLIEKNTELGEVVITGYQTIDKRKMSSSVVTLKADELKEVGAVSLDNMLQGKVTGLAVMNNSSTPGAAPKIRVRGSSSITGNREPVWVVDGVVIEDPVPLDPQQLNNLDDVNVIGNAIASINPEDIERIDVLKDASATAIYGVRAANGVIVVTTKKGAVGRTSVRYSNSFSVSTRPSYNDLNLMNSQQRIDVSKEIYQRGLTYNFVPANVAYEGALFDLFSKNITQEEFALRVKQMEEQNTDWFDILFRNAFTQKHTLSVSGASDKTNYYFSGAVSNNQSTVRGSGVKQYNALMKLSFNLTKKLDVNFQLRGSLSDKEYLHSSVDPFEYAYNTSRAIPCYNSDGSKVFYNTENSNYDVLTYNVKNEIENSGRTIQNQSLNFNANLGYRFTTWLNYSSLLSLSRSTNNDERWVNDQTYYAARERKTDLADWDPNNQALKENSRLPYGGEYANSAVSSGSYTFRNSLNFNKSFGDNHYVSSTLGSELRSTQYNGLSTYQRGYLPERGKNFVAIDPLEYPKYKEWLLSHPDDITDQITNVVSLYATATYSYKERYSFNANIRTDGSNKFGQDPKNRFLPLWAASFRWNLHNESFLENVSAINLMAFRFSYGIQGNISPDQTPNLIIRQGTLDNISHEYISSLDRLPNPNLRWEKTRAFNFGLDFAMFKNRFGGTVELYSKYGSDQIIQRAISTTNGVSSVTINGGNIENKGWEFMLRGQVIRTKDFTWDLSVNAYKNYNKVTKSGASTHYNYADYIYGRLIEDGKSVDGFYSYKFGGLDNNGYPIIKDIEETEGISEIDMYNKVFVYSGQRTPDFNGGFTSTLRYKNISMNMLFSFSMGKKIRLNSLFMSSGQRLPQPQQNLSGEFVNRWRKPGDENNTNIPTLSDDPLTITGFGADRRVYLIGYNLWEMYNKSDLRVVSGDYLRLRTLTLRYSLPTTVCKRLKISGVDFRFEGNNLFLIADSRLHGQDPEQITFGGGAVPPTQTYVFGIDVTF